MVLHRWVGEYNRVILYYQLSLDNLQNYKGQHPPLLFLKKTRENKKNQAILIFNLSESYQNAR